MQGMHVQHGWHGDSFAPECGCDFAPCGMVDPKPDCDQHGPMAGRTMRGGHPASECPASPLEGQDMNQTTNHEIRRQD